MDVARPLAEEAFWALKPGGFFLLELAPENIHRLAEELRGRWEGVEVLRDLAGRDRYLRARRPAQKLEGKEGPFRGP